MILVTSAMVFVASLPARQTDFEIVRVESTHPVSDVELVHVDGDRHLDALVVGGGRMTVLRGDGAGGLVPTEVVAAGENAVDVEVGDIDSDGRIDAVIANHETSYLTLLLQGEEGFGSGVHRRLPIDVSPHPHAVALADLDGDGHLDLLVDDRDRERVLHHRGRGDGRFTASTSVAVGGDPYRGLSLADLDGDGHLDVVTPNPTEVAVQRGDGRGGFEPMTELPSGDVPPFSVAVGDFDGDGRMDIAAGSGEGPGAIRYWLQDGNGRLVEPAGPPVEIPRGPTALCAADLDGDGSDELLVTGYQSGTIAVVAGASGRITFERSLPDHPWNPAVGDLNEDGRPDVVVAADAGSAIYLLLARTDGGG